MHALQVLHAHQRILAAERDEGGEDAHYFRKLVTGSIAQATRTIPFSSAQRAATVTIHTYGGYPSLFYTISPAEMDMLYIGRTGGVERVPFTYPQNTAERIRLAAQG